jgi:hypothetical protein
MQCYLTLHIQAITGKLFWIYWLICDRLKVYENRVLRRMFRPKRDKVTGDWRKQHSEGLHNLYSSPYIIRMINLRRMR